MKTTSFLSLIAGILLLSSCDVTREITIAENGSGQLSNTMDMSAMIGLAKMSGKGMDDVADKKLDTTVALSTLVDSLQGFSAEEKKLISKGNLSVIMNMEDEKFVTKMQFPFASTSELAQLNKLAGKAMQQAIKKQLDEKKDGGDAPPGMDEDMPEGSLEDYFTTSYANGVIEKKLDATKYADVANDKGMQAMKEMAGQGMPINNTIIYNLPRPAKKVTGKNATLSADKKKVTITEPIDDFFDDGKNLEFKIEY